MNATSTSLSFRGVAVAAALTILALAAPACERSEESFRAVRNAQATQPYPPPQENADLMKRLEAAREMDYSEANRPGVSPIAWEDYMTQAGKANKALRELSHGLEVPGSELNDALWVPPASESGPQKARLIQEVQQAIQRDQHEEDALVADSQFAGLPYPVNEVVRLEDHEKDAEGVLRDLQIGKHVHWDAIKRATQVPAPED